MRGESARNNLIEALMDADELGQLLKKSRSWVYQAVQAGEVPHIRIGGNVRFSREAIRKWLEQQQAG